MGPGNNIPAAQFGFALDQTGSAIRLNLVAGDYSVALPGGTTYSLKSYTPRIIDGLKGLAFPAVMFYVDGGGAIQSIWYAWKINDTDSGTFRNATADELALLYKGDAANPGHIGCSEASGGAGTVIDCELATGNKGTDGSGNPIVSGVAAASSCSKWTAGELLSHLENCYVSSRDVFGSQVAYSLRH